MGKARPGRGDTLSRVPFHSPEGWADFVTERLIQEDQTELRRGYTAQFEAWRSGGFTDEDILRRLGDAELARRGFEQTYITRAEEPALLNKLRGSLWSIPLGAAVTAGLLALVNYSEYLPPAPRLLLLPLAGLLIAALLGRVRPRLHPGLWIFLSQGFPWLWAFILLGLWLRQPNWASRSAGLMILVAFALPGVLGFLGYLLRDRDEERKLRRLSARFKADGTYD